MTETLARRTPGRRAWVRRLVLLAIAGVATFVIVRLVGAVDWAEVWDALSHLSWWQPIVLLVVLVVRQVLNALPLALYIPGVSAYRATHQRPRRDPDVDGRATPQRPGAPDGDVQLLGRAHRQGAGRHGDEHADVLHRALLGAGRGLRAPGRHRASARPAVVRAAQHRDLGHHPGRRAVRRTQRRRWHVAWERRLPGWSRRVRKDVDAEAWAQACLGFRRDISARFRHGFPRSLVALVGMLVADLAILVLCLRFVGVDRTEVGLLAIGVAYLFAYPFTIFPFSGHRRRRRPRARRASSRPAASRSRRRAVAALLVWRVFTVAGPVLMGVGALAIWRRTLPREPVRD